MQGFEKWWKENKSDLGFLQSLFSRWVAKWAWRGALKWICEEGKDIEMLEGCDGFGIVDLYGIVEKELSNE